MCEQVQPFWKGGPKTRNVKYTLSWQVPFLSAPPPFSEASAAYAVMGYAF